MILSDGSDPGTSQPAGLWVLTCFVALVVLTVAWAACVRAYKNWNRLKPHHSGALRYAAATGNTCALEKVSLAPNFAPDDDHVGFTALHAAAVCNQLAAAEWLLRCEADANAATRDGYAEPREDVKKTERLMCRANYVSERKCSLKAKTPSSAFILFEGSGWHGAVLAA